MLETPLEFIDSWNQWAKIVALTFLAISLFLFLKYFLRMIVLKDPKAKYDLINENEIKAYRGGSAFFIIAVAFFANSFLPEIGIFWFSIRMISTISLGVILGVVLQNVLKFYYPFFVEKRLKKLRFTPRISPKSGKEMKLLTEEEEDVYLDEGMQAEENTFSIDYDVWVDDESGYTKIEKYSGHMHALQCPECNYQTFKVDREEITVQPTELEEGELIKYFECGYCGHLESRKFKVGKTQHHESESSTETAPAV